MNIKQLAVAVPLALAAVSAFAQSNPTPTPAMTAAQAKRDFIIEQIHLKELQRQGFDVFSPS